MADVDDRDPVAAGGRCELGVAVGPAAVDHYDDVRVVVAHAVLPGELRALAEVGAEHRREIVEVVGDQAGRPRTVASLAVLGVRQPLCPVPVGDPVVGDAERQAQVARRVERRDLADHRTRQAQDPRALAGDLDLGEGAQRTRHGKCLHRRVGTDETPQRGRRHRVEVLEGCGLRCAQRRGQALRAGADPHPAEVRIRAPPLPHSRAADECPEVRGQWIRGIERGPLAFGHVTHLLAKRAQVALIVTPVVVDLRLLRHAAA